MDKIKNVKVIKRDGSVVDFDYDKATKQLKIASKGLKNVNYMELIEELKLWLNTDKVKTDDIQDFFIKRASSRIDIDRPDWTYMAARLYTYNKYHLYKKIHNKSLSGDVYNLISLKDHFELLNKHYELSFKLSRFDMGLLQEVIDNEYDKLFKLQGVYNMFDRYGKKLYKDNNIYPLELPQHVFMRVAMFLANAEKTKKERTFWAKKIYLMLANHHAMVATPFLSNGGFKRGQIFSCYVGSSEDSLESIFDGYKEQAIIHKFGGGIGWDYTSVRAKGSKVANVPNASKGIISWLKISQDIMNEVDQLGTRKGSTNAYVRVFSLDIFDVLYSKKNSGDVRTVLEDLFISLSIDNVFIERYENDDYYTLFDPYDVPDLVNSYGDKFKEIYLKYEEKAKKNPDSFTVKPKRIKAKEIMKAVITTWYERGNPFMFFVDNANSKHKHPEEGMIRTSNLCMEIMQPTDSKRTALCNLGSINFGKIYDLELLKDTAITLTRALDNAIDVANYLKTKHKRVEKSTRAIGVGVMGEAEHIAKSSIMYGSKEHEEWINIWYKTLYETVNETSKQLAVEKGPWKEGKDMRNAYTSAIAPTGTISLVCGTTSSHEPVFGRKWIEENILGGIKMTAPDIDVNNYLYYKPAHELDQSRLIELTAIRQKYVDQGISHNVYIPKGKKIKASWLANDIILKANKLGLKSLYYLRTRSSNNVDETSGGMENEITCTGCE